MPCANSVRRERVAHQARAEPARVSEIDVADPAPRLDGGGVPAYFRDKNFEKGATLIRIRIILNTSPERRVCDALPAH